MIKISSRFIFAVLAAIVVLASSCTKEIPAGQDSDPKASQSEGSRVISVSFASSTKTALGDDGLTPEFTGQNEWIIVSNSSMSENCKVVVSPSGRASITTSLNGALKAVYPAYTAKMDGSRISGIDIPSYQDGTFASANICMAEMEDEKEEGLTFHNKTALFAIIPPEGTAQLKVTSLRPVGSDGTRSGYALPISTGQEFDAITITATGKDSDGKVYLSLCPGVNLSDLSFEAEFSTTGTGSIKGIPMKAIEEAEAVNSIASGTMYTINENNWHPYVTVAGRKWATMNIGAEKPEDAGDYFMWGEVIGHKYENGKWTNFPETNPDGSRYTGTWTPTSGFAGCNAPFVSTYDYDEFYWTCSYSKYNETDGKNRLDLCDDAAFANWGGAWRMPTKEEFDALLIATSSWDGTNAGYGFGESSNKIFLPTAGYGAGVGREKDGDGGNYWSSSLDTNKPDFAWYLYFDVNGVCTASNGRCYGLPIRAIIDDGASAPAPGKKEIVLWEGEAVADDWGNQPYLLSDGGQELADAGATEGQEVRFYITAIEDNWILQIHEGHWGSEYCGYCSVGNDDPSAAGRAEYDLDANGGYISLSLTQAMLDAAFMQQYWGGTFIANGDNVKIIKITLY